MPTQGSFMKLRPVTWVQKLRKPDIKHISAVTFNRLEPLFVRLEQRKELLNGAYEWYPFIQMYLTRPLFSSSAGTSALWAVTRVIQNRLIQKCRITAFHPLTQSQLETYCVAAFWIVWVLRFQTAHRWRFTVISFHLLKRRLRRQHIRIIGNSKKKIASIQVFAVGKGKPATGSDGVLICKVHARYVSPKCGQTYGTSVDHHGSVY